MRWRGVTGASILARCAVALLLMVGGAAPALATEFFLAARPEAACPCGGGDPPPLPCGAAPGRPLSCWPDAYARASAPGDTVTFLEGEHQACLLIERRGGRTSPFTYRGRPGAGVTVRCPTSIETVRLTGRGVVIEDLRVVAAPGTPAAVRIVAGDKGAGGRHVLRRLSIEGGRVGMAIAGSGENLIDGVSITRAVTGLEVGAPSNRLRGLRIEDTEGPGLVLAAGAEGNRVARFEARRTGTTGVVILPSAGRNIIEDFLIAGTGGHGLEIRGAGTVARRGDVSGARYHGVLIAGRDGPVTGVRLEAGLIHHNGSTEPGGGAVGDGLKIESSTGAIVRDMRIFANTSNGILEIDTARDTLIERCTIEDNGTTGFAHGVYTKGRGGRIRECRVRRNSGYGLHLWAAPGDYTVERNEVTGNGTVRGGGIVVGGTPSEAPPGGSGLPERVVVRRNRLAGNLGPALDYLLPVFGPEKGCWPGTAGNEFIDNDITPSPGTLPVRLRGARQGCVTLRGNRIRPAADQSAGVSR